MGFYADHIFPRLMDWTLRGPVHQAEREKALESVRGELPFPDERFDCVVTTLTLCSIRDPVAALRQIRRVLKPEGTYVFLEHGRSDDERVARRQDFFNPLQRRVGCGCNINRRIDALIREAGLEVRSLERYVLRGNPRIMAEMYRGTA